MKGFTLIEIMVVVLIIGVLAAMALPEYKKAIEMSRASEGVSLLRALYVAEEAHMMARGQYASSLDDLDLTFKGEKKTCLYSNNNTPCVSYYSNEEIWGKDWAIGLEKASSTNNASISVMRINGPYTGTGFFMQMNRTPVQYPLKKFACVESNVGPKKYKGKAHSYCVDMMDAEYAPIGGTNVRKYDIVWQ